MKKRPNKPVFVISAMWVDTKAYCGDMKILDVLYDEDVAKKKAKKYGKELAGGYNEKGYEFCGIQIDRYPKKG